MGPMRRMHLYKRKLLDLLVVPLCLRSSPLPPAPSFAPAGASQRSLGDQQQGTMIRSEVTGNLEIHDREFVMKVRRSVSTRYLANKQRQMKQIYYNWECFNALSYE